MLQNKPLTQKKWKVLAELFLTMMKIGLFTFGGGYAMIPILQSEFVDKKKWMTEDEFHDMLAVSESTPGPIAINNATFIGYKKAKFFGSLVSTIGVVIPSFVIIYLISLFFDAFLSLTLVSAAFRGIKICVIYLIFSAGLRMYKKEKKTTLFFLLFSAVILTKCLLSLFAIELSTIWMVLGGGLIGLFVWLIAKNIKRGDAA